METNLGEILSQVERYLGSLMNSSSSGQFSKEENRILVLQQINRLNQRIGQLARSSKELMPGMKTLQTHVNNLTIGVKNDNVAQMKHAFTLVKNLVDSLESHRD